MPAQLSLLELPWEKILEAVEEDMLSVVGLCLEQSERPVPSPQGLAMDFVFEPMRNEARVTEVRYREESHAKPAELLECVEALASIGPVPMEVADGLEDGVFTLRVGTNRLGTAE